MFFFIFGFFWKNIKTWVKNWVATDAIELILKIKISIEDWIEQIKNWKLIQKFDNFWRIFLLNETTRFVQNNVISLTIHKKKRGARCCFYNAVHHLLPLDVQRQGGEGFSSPPL